MIAIAAVPSALITLASPAALAHTGHVAESAGHSHWLGLVALMAAVGVAAWIAVRAAARRAQRSRGG